MAQATGNGFTKINLTCLCKQITASANVPNAELPRPLTLCQCDTCRHHTGTLSYTCISLRKGLQLEVRGKPKGYKPFKAEIERFFCPNCGTMVYEDSPDGRTFVCTGALTKAEEGITKLDEQIFVGDTKDGGCSVWFPKLQSWEGWDGKSPEYDLEGAMKKSSTKIKAAAEPDKLLCYCHCKGVQFTIKPASSVTNPKTVEQLRLQESGTKYLASFCVCNDCRIATGHDLQPWAYIPETSIEKLDGSPVVFSQDGFDLGTAKQYKSSEEARREFCGDCGATLFWHAWTHDPGRIDVSVGLMAAESGARAEEWLSWRTERVSHRGLEQNKEIVDQLLEGLSGYGERRA